LTGAGEAVLEAAEIAELAELGDIYVDGLIAISSYEDDGYELWCRAMSYEEYNQLGPNGEISIRDTENFVTRNLVYSLQLAYRPTGQGLYHVLVVYVMQPGTEAALRGPGAISNGAEIYDPTLIFKPHISSFRRKEPNVVHIKGEIVGLNYGLRRNTVGIFNSRIELHQGFKL
jgi:hypothetical protein